MPQTPHADWFTPYQAAMQKLQAMPGVISVGLGHKEKKGEVLPGFALRVYVARKKPADQVAPEELIPAFVDGIPTDVLVEMSPKPDASFSTPTAAAGRGVDVFYNSVVYNQGTIGVVVQAGGVRYMTGNRHVFVDSDTDAISYEIYTPSYSDCETIKCREKSGMVAINSGHDSTHDSLYVVAGKNHFIDCALATLTPEARVDNNIPGKGDLKPDINDLTLEPLGPDGMAPLIPVKVAKLGAKTGYTEGTVVELMNNGIWKMVIKPLAGKGFPIDVTYELGSLDEVEEWVNKYQSTPVKAFMVDEKHVRFLGETFSLPGDSGAPVFDENLRVVGIHFGSHRESIIAKGEGSVIVPYGISFDCHAIAAWHKLGLDPNNAILPSSGSSTGPALTLDAPAQVQYGIPEGAYELSESDFYKTRAGKEIIDAFHVHSAELVALVHHHRPVKVAWNRNHGPHWAALLLQGLKQPHIPVFRQENMETVSGDMDRFFAVLQREASPPLRRDMEKFIPRFKSLIAGMGSFAELIGHLKAEERV